MVQPFQKDGVWNGWGYSQPVDQLATRSASSNPGPGSFQMLDISQPVHAKLTHPFPLQQSGPEHTESFSNDQALPNVPPLPAPPRRTEKGSLLPGGRLLHSLLLGIPILLLIIFSICLYNENRDLEKKHGRIAEASKKEVGRYLIENEAHTRELARLKTITYKDDNGNSKLHLAVNNYNEAEVRTLMESGANVNERNNKLETPLHVAAMGEQLTSASLRIMKYLIENRADVFLKDVDNRTFLHDLLRDNTTLTLSQFKDLTGFLIRKTYSNLFNVPGGANSGTPFAWAVQEFELEEATLTLLHKHGVNFNAVDDDGDSVLFNAVFGNRSATLLSNLVELGADWKHLNNNQESLLHWAASMCNLDTMQYFTNRGLNINAIDGDGDTPLHCVIYSENGNVLEGVRLLIQNGADVNIENNEGNTPLAVALNSDNLIDKFNIVQMLKSG